MGSLSRPSPFSGRLTSSTDDNDGSRIYVPFCTKNGDGDTSTFIDCYTPSTNSLHRTTSIPGCGENLVLKNFAMVSVRHHIYVIGGRLGRRAAEEADALPSRCLDPMPRVVALVRRYNVNTDTWETCTPMAEPRFNFACTVSEDKIYVAGGQSTPGSAKGMSSAEVYDPAMDQWSPLADMTTKRYNCVGVNWHGKIHVVGGFVGSENRGPFVMTRSSAEVYDPRRDRWNFVARMWELDVPPYQIVAVNGKLFSSGDCLKPWKGHIEAYDEDEKIWNMVHGSRFDCLSPSSTPGATTRSLYLTMTPIGNRLYFLKAYVMPPAQMSEVHVFDTAADGGEWLSYEPIEEQGEEKQLCGHCCVVKQDS